MSEVCKFPICQRHPQKNGYCISHGQYANYNGELKDKSPVNKKSEKQKVEERKYKKIVKEMLATDDRCELKSPVCSGRAEGLHHMRRRGVNLLNRKFLKRSCNPCNGWCEKHPIKALELGLTVKVHAKDKK